MGLKKAGSLLGKPVDLSGLSPSAVIPSWPVEFLVDFRPVRHGQHPDDAVGRGELAQALDGAEALRPRHLNAGDESLSAASLQQTLQL